MVSKPNYGLFFSIIAAAIILVDQITKIVILRLNPEWNFFITDIHLITNTGAGFGLFPGQTFILGIISLLVGAGIILYYHHVPKHYAPQLLSAVLLGGVIGNLIDRFFRGYVIDFIDFRFWPAFNVADMAISLSIIGLIILLWKEEKKKEIDKN